MSIFRQNILEKQRRMGQIIEAERTAADRQKPTPPPTPLARPASGEGIVVRAKTQEAAQADAYISVKLLDDADAEVGDAFDATCIFTDGATAANTCLPDVATGKTVLISKIQGTWYIVNPTFTDWSECAS
jgi:hypothetical protein